MRCWLLGLLLGVVAQGVGAQDLSVYSDSASADPTDFDNGFKNYSYANPPAPRPNFANASPVRSGTRSIAFTPQDFNAVSFAHEDSTFEPAQYAGVRFYVHGGASGGQSLTFNVYSELGGIPDASQELSSYIVGGAVGANEWRLVEVRFANAPLSYTGSFRRFDIQAGGDGSAQPDVFIDDVSLISTTRPDPLFSDGFEGNDAGPAGTLQFTPAAPDQSVGENTATATFTVSRSGGTAGAVGVEVQLGGTAAVQVDYTVSPASLQLAWAAGDGADKTVTLALIDDATDEPNETVTLQLAAPTGGATLGAPTSATLTIVDNDPSPSAGTLQFTPASPDQSVSETSGAVTFTVSRTGGAAGAVGTTVALGGTATNPADYTNGALALSWPDGDATTRTVTITPVADLVDEPAETVTLQLGSPTGGATLGAPASATLTISDAELMYVPRYGAGSVRVYRREPGGFVERANAVLPAGTKPNAIAFARDGKLWVVNEDGTLQRYARSQILGGGSPAPEATITVPAPNNGCCLIDLAFFGEFAYVTRTDFGATHQVFKFPIASLAVGGSPEPTVLTNAALGVPAGLEFDPQGRLWITNFGANNLVRMNTDTGAVDRTGTQVGTANARLSLNQPEGAAFDAAGTLWVGNNGEPTISAYTAAQLDALGATVPAHQIDIDPGLGGVGNMVGGLAFDATGRLWANYQQTFEVLEYVVAPNGGGYTSAIGQRLAAVSTQPGFGGLAFWPVPATVHRSAGGGAAVATIDVDTDVVVGGMTSDRFTWIDASGNPRSAALAHNDKGQGPTSAGGYPNHGGAMREYRFTMPGGATRTATVTTYGNAGQGGFGYVVSHPIVECGGDGSPLGYGTPGTFERRPSGRHHAIFRFTQNYPRQCNGAGALQPTTIPVTIDWFFATGRDHPLWAITYDMSGFSANRFFDDSRAPYGEFNIDGDGFTHQVSGVAWGDRFKFESQAPTGVHLDSPWSYQGANSVPYVKLWITASDATMGIVQTQTLDQQDAGGGRNRFVYDLRNWWNETSAGDNDAGPGYAMPDQNYWPYQANSFSIGVGVANNNARLTWGTQYGFLGQASYETNNVLPAGINTGSAAGHPRKSYATYVVLGAHSTEPVEVQVAEVEAVQQTTLTANVGTVRGAGPAGPGRLDTAPYAPAGWDHVYGLWTVEILANAADGVVDADFNLSVGGGRSLRNPVFNVRNWQGTTLPATVSFNGTPLVQDGDYFPSIIDDADELLITLARTVAGATNRLQVSQ